MTSKDEPIEDYEKLIGEYEEFVAQAHERLAAGDSMFACLREYSLQDPIPIWPVGALASIAQYTLSDGAAFVCACGDGSLGIIQEQAEPGPSNPQILENGPDKGILWNLCNRVEDGMFFGSHLHDRTIASLGLRLPAGSSVMADSLRSGFLRTAGLCVWRSPQSESRYSAESYEVWDKQAFTVAARLVCVTVDARHYLDEATRLDGISRSARAMMEVFKPQMVVLYSMTDGLQDGVAAEMRAQLRVLDDAMACIERSLILRAPKG